MRSARAASTANSAQPIRNTNAGKRCSSSSSAPGRIPMATSRPVTGFPVSARSSTRPRSPSRSARSDTQPRASLPLIATAPTTGPPAGRASAAARGSRTRSAGTAAAGIPPSRRSAGRRDTPAARDPPQIPARRTRRRRPERPARPRRSPPPPEHEMHDVPGAERERRDEREHPERRAHAALPHHHEELGHARDEQRERHARHGELLRGQQAPAGQAEEARRAVVAPKKAEQERLRSLRRQPTGPHQGLERADRATEQARQLARPQQ